MRGERGAEAASPCNLLETESHGLSRSQHTQRGRPGPDERSTGTAGRPWAPATTEVFLYCLVSTRLIAYPPFSFDLLETAASVWLAVVWGPLMLSAVVLYTFKYVVTCETSDVTRRCASSPGFDRFHRASAGPTMAPLDLAHCSPEYYSKV